jgi:thiosulfate dehydrogenase [quinone] large subunit
MALPRSLAQRVGPVTAARLENPGYLLLPLRVFLGGTFCYAGLQKLANPAYLDSSNPASVYAQMRALQGRSPIGPLVSLATHAPTLVGLLIALGELAVGVGTLLGLLSRVAAAGGALLALSFFLTVSWNTAPYYYGSDVVFLFAWTVLIAFGSGGVLSMDAWLRGRARRQVGLPPERRPVAVAPPERLSPRKAAELNRRTLLTTGAGMAGVAAATAFVAGTTAAVGRANNDARAGPDPGAFPPPAPRTQPGRQKAPGSPEARTSKPAIMAASSVPVGQAKSFRVAKTGQPAWLVRVAAKQFVAFSAICTHAGCTIEFNPAAEQFVCPCHGGTFDAKTGRVLAGPPPAPLAQVPVQFRNGEVFAA